MSLYICRKKWVKYLGSSVSSPSSPRFRLGTASCRAGLVITATFAL